MFMTAKNHHVWKLRGRQDDFLSQRKSINGCSLTIVLSGYIQTCSLRFVCFQVMAFALDLSVLRKSAVVQI